MWVAWRAYKYFNMDEAILNALELFDKYPRCTPGTFTSAEQWIKLFPGGTKGMGLDKKALIFIPVGGKAATQVNETISKLGTENYHFLLVRYDDYDWSHMEWYDKVEWEVNHPTKELYGRKPRDILTPEKVKPYSHVCRWDDDLTPTQDFDGTCFYSGCNSWIWELCNQ